MRKVSIVASALLGALQIIAIACTAHAVTAPTVTALGPSTVVAGSGAFTITIRGTNFVNGSTVIFAHEFLPTTYVSATSLTASVPATAVASPDVVLVGVGNGGGNRSDFLPFAVSTPAPTIASLSPDTVTAQGPAFKLTIDGNNFTSRSVVRFGSVFLTPVTESDSELTVNVPAALVEHWGAVPVLVRNGPLSHSDPKAFLVTPSPAGVEYFLGSTDKSNDDGVGVRDLLHAESALDLTQPATVTLTDASVDPATQVFTTGIFSLTDQTTDPNSATQLYTYNSGSLVVAVTSLSDNYYKVQLAATGLAVSSAESTATVTVTISLGGQTFTATVAPSVAKL